MRHLPRTEPVPTPTTEIAIGDVNLADPGTWERDDIEGILALRRELEPIAADTAPGVGSGR